MNFKMSMALGSYYLLFYVTSWVGYADKIATNGCL
jgi:hypothetical protein